jgi:alkylation response protein AidB-like acyl-CoA dehydrogenase
MDFSLTDEQRMIQHTARTLLGKECSLDLVRSAWDNPALAEPLWQDHLQEWLGLAEQSTADVSLFMEEYGRALVPGVYFPSLLAAFAANAIEVTLSGSATVAVAGADGFWIPNGETTKHFVPCAGQVDEIVVIHGSPEKPSISIVAAERVALTPVDQLDRLRPQYQVAVPDIDHRSERGVARGSDISPQAWQQVVQRALVATAAELVGVGRHLLDSAVAYAKEREQFGRPIGSFQGLQWKLVDAALELERAAAAVAWAAMCVDANTADAAVAVHSAKLEAGSAARRCARTSLQLHGGIGYTWEHGLHFWLRRAYAGDAFMGSSDYHARCLADVLFAA